MKLPVSSFKVLRIIILGYLHQGGSNRQAASLRDVEKSTGVRHTVISGNNGALADLGLIERQEGRGYRLTEPGLEVARALEFEEPELTKRALGSVLTQNREIPQALNMLRVRGEMESEAFAKHLMLTLGQERATPTTQTGARALIDMLSEAGLVRVEGDRIFPASAPEPALASPEEQVDDVGTFPSDRDQLSPVVGPADVAIEKPQHGITISISVTLSADDLADSGRAEAILHTLRRLSELHSE
jgi:hypothetical protein